MKLFWILFLFELTLFVTQCPSQRLNKGTRRIRKDTPIFFDDAEMTDSDCRDANDQPGTCMSIYECKPLLKKLQDNLKNQDFRLYLQKSVCRPKTPIICCISTQNPERKLSKLMQVQENCGITTNSHKKIIGGQIAKKGSWPWIALLGYDEPYPFRCGGTLISVRHVLTAAHCLHPTLIFVRLGEHDLTTDSEAAHVDIEIEKSIRYPDYNVVNKRGDLAILLLKEDAPLNDHINVICLPSTPQFRSKSYVGYSPFIAGWGRTELQGSSSTILMELQIPIRKNVDCAIRYARLNFSHSANQFDDAVVCAGVLTGGKDTCKGDSGGPLMIPETTGNGVRYYILGVISYGIDCARADVPSVYASVQYFMDWILKQISTTA